MTLREFKIDISTTPKEHVDGLILGLIYSGYSTYISIDENCVCFTGYKDDVMTKQEKGD